MFNRHEQVALVLLAAALLVGGGVALYQARRPEALETFHLAPAAVPVPASAPSEAVVAGKLRLNAATAAELATLPAIGPKTAGRIVEYRRLHGPFVRLDDLMDVPGVGPRTLAKVRSLIDAD